MVNLYFYYPDTNIFNTKNFSLSSLGQHIGGFSNRISQHYGLNEIELYNTITPIKVSPLLFSLASCYGIVSVTSNM